MANLIKTTKYGAPEKQILISEDSYKVTLGAVIGNTGVTADSNGRKIIKAGTPLHGDLTARETAFVKATETGESTKTSNATAVALHDVDVTDGNSSVAIVVAGVVDLNKLDSSVQTLITAAAKAALPHIIFIK